MSSTEMVDSDTPVAATATASARLHLDILKFLKRTQMRNGLKDTQYPRYHQYCSRRLHRIRTHLALTQAGPRGGRYRSKPLDAAQCTTAEHLTLPLLLAERAWAYAMEMQADQTALGFSPSRRTHIVHRLKKAAKHAEMLVALTTAVADEATQLQAQVYAEWLTGCHKLELEDWAGAAALLTQAKGTFQQLSTVGDLDLKAICEERAQQTGLLLSLCSAQLHRADPEAAAALLDLLSVDAGAAQEQLQAKLRAVMEDSLRSDAHKLQELSWRGHVVPLASERTRLLLVEAQQLQQQLNTRLSAVDATRGDESVAPDAGADAATTAAPVSAGARSENALYNRLLSVLEDAETGLRSSLKELSQAKVKTDVVVAEARAVEIVRNFVAVQRLSASLERNVGTAHALTRKFHRQAAAARAAAAAGHVRKTTQAALKPAALVTVFDRLLQNLSDLDAQATAIPVAAGAAAAAPADARASTTAATLSARRAGFAAARVHFLSLSFAAAGRSDEALALATRCIERCDAALTELKAVGSATLVGDIDLVENLRTAAEAAVLTHSAAAVARQVEATASARKGLAEVSLGERAAQGELFVDRLNSFDAGAVGRQFDLVRIPPALEPVPLKPFLFDLAANGFAYPDLSHRVPAEEEKPAQTTSFWGRIWG